MKDTEVKFNDLVRADVKRRVDEQHKKFGDPVDEPDYEDAYWAENEIMQDLSWGRQEFSLDGKPVTRLLSKGGPESDRDYWMIVVEYDGVTYMCNASFDSYEYSELGTFYEAESYVEPVTKYRRLK